MPQQPIRATPGGSGWIRDSSGMMAPVGSGSSIKEFIQLPKEARNLAIGANTLIRGNLPDELAWDLGVLGAIGPNHLLTQQFISYIIAASKARRGQATTDMLQASVNMIVPSALSPYIGSLQQHKDNRKFSKNNSHYQDGKVAEDNE